MTTPFKRKLGEGYPFHYRKGPSEKGGPLVCIHHYTFRTRKNKRYAVQVEQYQHHVYVLKYYPLSHKNSPNKFRVLTNDGDAFRILTTCFQIFLDVYRRDPLASAGFIGEALVGEDEANAKRFRVYMQSVLTFADPEHFVHLRASPGPGSQRLFSGKQGQFSAESEAAGGADVSQTVHSAASLGRASSRFPMTPPQRARYAVRRRQ